MIIAKSNITPHNYENNLSSNIGNTHYRKSIDKKTNQLKN
jgi:hypothetical protein